jgi:F0F1-type ATP synthase membrane subunit b/b'
LGAKRPHVRGKAEEDSVLALPNYSLLLVMACFWLVFLLVSTQLVRPLGRLLEEREGRIEGARQAHERARTELTEAMARCDREVASAAAEAQKERATLRAAGEAARRARLDEARAQVQARLSKLGAELDEASLAARAVLRKRGAELARELASRVAGRSIV